MVSDSQGAGTFKKGGGDFFLQDKKIGAKIISLAVFFLTS
jgi:hypothetical protein